MPQRVNVKLAMAVEFMANSRPQATARVAGIRAALINEIEHGVGGFPTGVIPGSVKVDITKQEITETS